MQHYRVYLLRDGRISWGSDVYAAGDVEAIEEGSRLAGSLAFEVWSGRRLVKAGDSGPAAPAEPPAVPSERGGLAD